MPLTNLKKNFNIEGKNEMNLNLSSSKRRGSILKKTSEKGLNKFRTDILKEESKSFTSKINKFSPSKIKENKEIKDLELKIPNIEEKEEYFLSSSSKRNNSNKNIRKVSTKKNNSLQKIEEKTEKNDKKLSFKNINQAHLNKKGSVYAIKNAKITSNNEFKYKKYLSEKNKKNFLFKGKLLISDRNGSLRLFNLETNKTEAIRKDITEIGAIQMSNSKDLIVAVGTLNRLLFLNKNTLQIVKSYGCKKINFLINHLNDNYGEILISEVDNHGIVIYK